MDGIFDLLIPQAIGKWVQHGDACSVNHGHHFVETQGDAGTRPDITKEKRAIQDRHSCPTCRAGRGGFASPVSRADLQDGDEDVSGGAQDSQATVDALSSSHDKNHPLVETGVSTHKGKQRGQVTEEVVMTSGMQNGRRKASRVHRGVQEPGDIGTHHQLDLESLGYGDGIQQWVSGVATAAIGHGRQRKHSAMTKNSKCP